VRKGRLLLSNIQSKVSGRKLIFTALSAGLLLFFLLDIFLGSVHIKPAETIRALINNSDEVTRTIIMNFRLPRAVTAVMAGIALSLSGLQMQTLFRNPMAGPYVLGLSSGAGLGVAFVILGFSSDISPESIKAAGNWAIAGASWIGAGMVMILIMIISARVKNIMTLLIIGIMLSSGISAIVSILQYFSSETMLKTYVVWTMGSLGNLTSSQIIVLALSVFAGLLISLLTVKILNALLLGENYARTLGLNLRSARMIIITGTSILTGTITAFCGPIAFIGIAVPHLVRLMFGTSDHKVLIPATVLTGALLMLASDLISQLPGSDNVLPVNSVTSLIGIPVVMWVIFRNQKTGDIF
jgi:iron complex transport system permease protein